MTWSRRLCICEWELFGQADGVSAAATPRFDDVDFVNRSCGQANGVPFSRRDFIGYLSVFGLVEQALVLAYDSAW